MARARISISFLLLGTVLTLLCFAGGYYLLEQVGVVPVIVLTNAAFSAGENAIIFAIALGALVFLALLLTVFILRRHR